MMARTSVLLAGLALAASILSTDSAQGASVRLRVLILTGKHNHDWQKTTPALKKIYEESGRFRVDVTEDPSSCTAETFAKYDVLVGNWTNWPSEAREWGAETEEAFLDFVRSGKGFVLFHAGGSTFFDWPEFHELIGATWDKEKTGHGRYHEFEVTITNNEHPVTRGMKSFVTTDELWHRMGTQPTMRVLAKAFSDTSKGGLGGLYRPTGNFEPVVLYTEFGKGRCFNLVLGHDVKSMENVGWKTLMVRGAEWAATGDVTYPIPAQWPEADQSETE